MPTVKTKSGKIKKFPYNKKGKAAAKKAAKKGGGKMMMKEKEMMEHRKGMK